MIAGDEPLGEFMFTREIARSPSGATRRWELRATNTDSVLGLIRWFGRWRQYCFEPNTRTVFNGGCLMAINGFLRKQTEAHRKRCNHVDVPVGP